MQPVIRYTCIVLFFLVFCNVLVKAQQVPYLERPVTLNVTNSTIQDVFKSISTQCGVMFSYTQFDDKQKINIRCYKKSLRLVLNDILKTTSCNYKLKDKYIIIKCNVKAPPALINGYIYNAVDSTRIAAASIYVKQNKHSAVSDNYGFFSLTYSGNSSGLAVSFAKENYLDTTMVLFGKGKDEVLVYLYPRQQKLLLPADTEIIIAPPIIVTDTVLPLKKDSVVTDTALFSRFMKRFKEINSNFRNISDTLFSNFSVSLVPYVSTNRLLSINTVNKFSFNILAGYSKGVRGAEIGGLVNIDNGDVQYMQLAGLGNVVLGNVKGFQIGGLFNGNTGQTQGIQVGGIINVNKGTVKGTGIAGITNIAAGSSGIQLSGILNLSRHTSDGIQLTGITNISGDYFKGIQLSGICNVADTIKGFQITGITNKATVVEGMQLSAIMNQAKKLTGVQLAILNFADTATGVPIGLFSFVKKGYHKIELSTDELYFANLSFRTGVERWHNILFGGINYYKPDYWTYGYGVGSTIMMNKKLGLTADLTCQQIQSIQNPELKLNMLNRLSVMLEYRPFSKFSIAAGPDCNFFIIDTTAHHPQTVHEHLSTENISDKNNQATNVRFWLGGKVSLKFL